MMGGLSSNLNAYAHVRDVLDAVLDRREDMRYELPTAGAATRWRMEAYNYRKMLLRQEERRAVIPGLPITTPYDNLRLSIYAKEPCVVLICFNKPVGVLLDASGNAVPTTSGPLSDDLLELALELKQEKST